MKLKFSRYFAAEVTTLNLGQDYEARFGQDYLHHIKLCCIPRRDTWQHVIIVLHVEYHCLSLDWIKKHLSFLAEINYLVNVSLKRVILSRQDMACPASEWDWELSTWIGVFYKTFLQVD